MSRGRAETRSDIVTQQSMWYKGKYATVISDMLAHYSGMFNTLNKRTNKQTASHQPTNQPCTGVVPSHLERLA